MPLGVKRVPAAGPAKGQAGGSQDGRPGGKAIQGLVIFGMGSPIRRDDPARMARAIASKVPECNSSFEISHPFQVMRGRHSCWGFEMTLLRVGACRIDEAHH